MSRGSTPIVLALMFAGHLVIVGCAEATPPSAWARIFPAARFVTAPAPLINGDVLLAVSSMDSRRASCAVVELDGAGDIRWSLPITAHGGQTLCTSVDTTTGPAPIVRGEAFDVDDFTGAPYAFVSAGGRVAAVEEGFAVTLDDDGLVSSLAPTPPARSAFPIGGDVVDVLGHELRAPSSAGYLMQSGAVAVDDATLVSLLVPQGTSLDPLVEGAGAAPYVGGADESVVVVARVE